MDASVQAGMCVARGHATGCDAKGTRRSRGRGVADYRRPFALPHATHIPAGVHRARRGGVRARLHVDPVRIYPPNFSVVHIDPVCDPRNMKCRILADSGTKIVSMVRNKSIRVVQTVAHNTNFDSFLVVKKVLCAPICTPRMDLFRTTETIFVPGWYKNSFNGTKRMKISAVFS